MNAFGELQYTAWHDGAGVDGDAARANELMDHHRASVAGKAVMRDVFCALRNFACLEARATLIA
ncbi:hypothetical protein [Rhizobium beringeri]|uniref:hypothetical protein n=1 Tax=Rhizobium beringeri TaxID=3019934 RepID=UPI003B5C0288